MNDCEDDLHTEDERTRVEFTQSCNAEGKHTWHWTIWVQNGHPYAQSTFGWQTLEDAIRDFTTCGMPKFEEAQYILKYDEIRG